MLLVLVGQPAAATETSAPVRLMAHPASVDLHGPQARHRILVTAVAPDGRLTDVTAIAIYNSQRPDVCTVTAGGECSARGDGATQATAPYAGGAVSVPVAVHDSKAVQAPSFLNDVEPIFTRLGCNQGACHGKNAGQN